MKSLKDLFSTADLAFLGTTLIGIGYGISYCYYLGYYSYYNVPLAFIELNQNTLPPTILVVLLVGLVVTWHVNNMNKDYKDQKEREERFRKYLSADIIGMLIPIPILGFVLFFLLNKAIGLIVVSIFTFPILVLTIQLIINLRKYIYIFVVIAVVLIASFILGNSFAKGKMNHYLLKGKEKQPYVMVGTYKDNYIIAPVNLKDRTVLPSYQLIEMKSDKDNKIELQRKHTGELKVKEYAD